MNSDSNQKNASGSDLRSAVFYGDEHTFERRHYFESQFKQRGFQATVWFHDPRELLGRPLAGRPGLMAALAAARRLHVPCVVPCQEDLRSLSEARKLVDAGRELGIEILVGWLRFDANGPGRDELDLAIKQFLAERLDVVIEVDALGFPVSTVEDALRESAAEAAAPTPSMTSPPELAPGRYLIHFMGTARTAESANYYLPVPPLPDLRRSHCEQQRQAAQLGEWLVKWQYWTQANIAGLLTEIGLRSRRGRPYSQPMVSILLRTTT